MTSLASLLRHVVQTLADSGAGFALVGGLAVSARTEPRFTRDVDVAVAADDDRQAETIVRALCPPYQVVASLEHDVLGRLAAVRLAEPGVAETGPVTDLLFASSGIEGEVAAAATPLDVFPAVRVPVAETGHLLALKLLARDDRRPQDDVDLHALMDVAEQADLDLATRGVALIEQRGAGRGRDLSDEWGRLLVQRGRRP